MKLLKKVCLAALVGAMASMPAYAHVETGSQKDVNLDLEYPLVYTEHYLAQDAINTDIANYVWQAKDAYYGKHVYQVSQRYKITYEDSQVVSLLLTTYQYNAGAAHGMYDTKGLVYNKTTGQRIPLYNYIKIANAEQLNQGLYSGLLKFYTQSGKKAEMPQGWSVDYASDNYYLKGKGYINLIYQPYELGPFSYGITFIEFSPKAIEYFNRMNR